MSETRSVITVGHDITCVAVAFINYLKYKYVVLPLYQNITLCITLVYVY